MRCTPEEFSLFHPAGYLQLTRQQLFGKVVANVGLFSALARHGGYRRINVLQQSQASASELAPQFFPPGAPQGVLATGTVWNTELPRLPSAAPTSKPPWCGWPSWGSWIGWARPALHR